MRLRIKILIAVVIILTGLFLSKDYILTESLSRYLAGRFGVDSRVDSAHLFGVGVAVEGVYFVQEGVNVKIRKAKVVMGFEKKFQPQVASLKVRGLAVNRSESAQPVCRMDFDISHISGPRYHIEVRDLRIGGYKLKAISSIAELKKGIVLVSSVDTHMVKQPGFIEGQIHYANNDRICIDFSFKNIMAEKVVEFFDKQDSFMLKGLFSGALQSCFKDGTFSGVQAVLHDSEGGNIDIKKEANLDFLKKRLDDESYNTLIDNFRNYTYNEGGVKVRQDNRDLIVDFGFDSKKSGERNLTINFHNITGGAK